MFRLEFTKSAQKQKDKLDRQFEKRIERALTRLMLEPGLGKPLSGDFKGFYSLKVWPLRIIYQIDMKNNVIYVTRIGQREGVYR